jgi:hypothetical protein
LQSNPTSISKKFVASFCEEHMKSPHEARIMLASTFVSCFAIFDPEYRSIVLNTILLLVNDMGLEKFEDGDDFVSCLKERFADRKKASAYEKEE